MIGLAMWGVAACGISREWLGAWGYLIWVPLIVLGAVLVLLIGHHLFLLVGIFEAVRRLFGGGKRS